MKLTDISAIPTDILADLRSRGLSDFDIAHSSPATLLDEYLCWHGIIGFTQTIMRAIKALHQAAAHVNIENDENAALVVRMMSSDEKVHAMTRALEMGGGHAKGLAAIWFHADSLNRRRFENAFPELFLSYRPTPIHKG